GIVGCNFTGSRTIMSWMLLVSLSFIPVALAGETADAAKEKAKLQEDKAKQQALLDTTLKEYNSRDKAKTLLVLLNSSEPEIKNTALKAIEELPEYCKIDPAVNALRSKLLGIRESAADILGAAGAEESVIPLFNALINDPCETVRQKSLNALLKLTTREKLIINLADVMKQEGTGPYHIRADAYMGDIGQGSDRAVNDMAARAQIIKMWPAGPRAHIFFGDIFTYLKDYDMVLINSVYSYAMPDPVVSTVAGGVTLDIRVTKVEEFITLERRIISNSLGSVSGRDYEEDAVGWVNWWSEENRKPCAQRYLERKAEMEQPALAKKGGPSDIEKRLKLGTWCKYQKQEKEAVQEFTAVLAKDAANAAALGNLKEMGYAVYGGQWQSVAQTLPSGEKSVFELVNQLKFRDESNQKEASAQLSGIDPIFKLRPFIKTLQADPVESARAYAAEGLAEVKEPKVVMPYLVKASIEDEAESVRTAAVKSINKLGAKESIVWYIYYLDKNPEPTVLGRAIEMLGNVAINDKLAIIELLRQMYRIDSAIRNAPAALNMLPPDMQYFDAGWINNITAGAVIIELPNKQLNPVKNPAPLKDTAEALLKVAGEALAKVTHQNFGADYVQWLKWWNAN
ncbi:MAG: HEAT repeat domain-containing protein, partial [Planctomycetota bacterium]